MVIMQARVLVRDLKDVIRCLSSVGSYFDLEFCAALGLCKQ